MTNILLFMLSCVFTHNVVFGHMLGITEAAKERRVELAAIYGAVTAVVMTLTSVIAYALEIMVLAPFGLEYFRVLVYVLVCLLSALLAQYALKAIRPAWAEALDGCLLPIAACSAVLGVAMLNVQNGYSFAYALINGVFGGVGFLLAVVLMAGVQEKLEFSNVPESFKGLPISLISAGLIALAFIGFKGIA